MNIFIFIFTFALAYFCFDRLLSPHLTDIYCKKILSDGVAEPNMLPARLISASFPSSQIFTQLSLPIPGREGEEIHIGTVAVNRSGVYIVCQIRGEGIIENPPDKRWTYITNGQSRDFENPFRAHASARELIEYYAKNAGLGYAKCHSLIVCTGQSLTFTYPKSRQMVSAEYLNRKFRKLDKLGRMSAYEVNDICKMLSDINQGADY